MNQRSTCQSCGAETPYRVCTACLEGPRFDYERQVWLDGQGNVLPCAHPASMGERCCMAYVLTGVRRGAASASAMTLDA